MSKYVEHVGNIENQEMSARGRFRAVRLVALAALVLTTASCAAPTPVRSSASVCRIASREAGLVNGRGERVVLRGPDLPAALGMERAGQSVEKILEEAAARGAGVVRVAVVDAEFTPTYVPLKLLPLVQKADALGLALILSWRNDPSLKLNKQVDDAEDFVRLLVPALRAYPNVWLDPFHDFPDAPVGRQRAVAERMVDIVRGLGDGRIVVLRSAAWMNDADPAVRELLSDPAVLYGVRSLSEWTRADALPLLVGDEPDAAVAVQLTGGGDPLGRAELSAWGPSGKC